MRQLFIAAVLLASSVVAAQNRGQQQAPTDPRGYAVAYIEVAASSRDAAIAAFKQYRDAGKGDAGLIRMELFEQIGRPGHFALIETMKDQAAADARLAAQAKKDLTAKLQPIRLSDYDQRPYKTLSVADSAAFDDRLVYVITHVDTSGPQAAIPGALQRLAELSRKETGNKRFDVLQHTMRANHFTVIEAWQNQQAVDAHAAAEHTKQYRETLGPALGSPLAEVLYKPVF
jgi:quinol monooxygenase YgiN